MKKYIRFGIIILLLFIIVLSSSYAYYMARVEKNGDNATAIFATKNLRLEYQDGPNINLDGVVPGQKIIKSFQVVNTSSHEQSYRILLKDVINTFERNDDIVYSLVDDNDKVLVDEESFPLIDKYISNNIVIGINETQHYRLIIEYKNLNLNQSVDMNKELAATVQLSDTLLVPGVYDHNDNLIATYADFVNETGFDVEDESGYYYSTYDNSWHNSSGKINDSDVPSSVFAKIIQAEKYADVKKIYFPDDVTKIGKYVFYGSPLTDVYISDSITSIGTSAFSMSSNLQNAYIGEDSSLTNLYLSSFSNSKIKKIFVPKDVSSINTFFNNMRYLSSINVDTRNTYFKSQDGVLFNASGTELVLYPVSKSDQSYTVPNSVTNINNYAFSSTQLSSINLSNNLTTIGNHAFDGSHIASVTIPSSVTSIGDNAFSNIYYLKSIVFESGINLTTIPKYFASSSKIEQIVIPNSVTAIDDYAFNLTSLANVTFNNNLTTIGESAFSNTKISNVVLPDSLETLGKSAFRSNSNLVSITIPNKVKALKEYTLYSCSNLETVTFKSNSTLERIEGYNFNNTKVKSITIPASVNYISGIAFNYNPLDSAYFENPNGWKKKGLTSSPMAIDASLLSDPTSAAQQISTTNDYWTSFTRE